MDKNKVKEIYFKGYVSAIKSLIVELKKQVVKVEAEIECYKRNE